MDWTLCSASRAAAHRVLHVFTTTFISHVQWRLMVIPFLIYSLCSRNLTSMYRDAAAHLKPVVKNVFNFPAAGPD